VKSLRKISKRLEDLQKAAVSAELAPLPSASTQGTGAAPARHNWKPLEKGLEEELADAGNEETQKLRERQREMIDALDMSK